MSSVLELCRFHFRTSAKKSHRNLFLKMQTAHSSTSLDGLPKEHVPHVTDEWGGLP